ncbi:MAG: efflux RND transporter periplasmic adaptor subunit [Pseudomonadota bacterium]
MMNAVKAFVVVALCAVAVVAVQRVIGTAKPAMPPRGEREAVVKVGSVEELNFADRIEAVGTAKANESVTVTATVPERIEKIFFEEGADVQAGDVLVQLEAAEERASLEEAIVDLDEQKRELERVRVLVEKTVQSRQEFDKQQTKFRAAQARRKGAEARLRDRIIVAPFSGVVGIRQISPGAFVQTGAVICTLDDIDRIKLEFTVAEVCFAALQTGQRIEARAAALPDRLFSGTVSIIDPRINQTTRAARVQAVIPNSERLLRPGMLLTVDLIANRRKSLSVPEACLVAYGEKQFVYVTREGGTVEKREVRIGRREVGHVEVLTGLRQGESVVTEGVMNVHDGAKVRIVGNEKDLKNSLKSGSTKG